MAELELPLGHDRVGVKASLPLLLRLSTELVEDVRDAVGHRTNGRDLAPADVTGGPERPGCHDHTNSP